MDNLTHSLVGAALSEAALREGVSPAQRRAFFAAGILSANLPDVDLVYVNITPPPLGYLLHHRGHTHTVIGLVAQGLIAWLVCRGLPPLRRWTDRDRARLLWLVIAGLGSHLLLDSGNSYGVHPFWPIDRRWSYGDAVFIFEPWLWVVLGVAVAGSARSAGPRIGVPVFVAALTAAAAAVGAIPLRAVVALGAFAVALAAGARPLAPRTRAVAALALASVFILTMSGLSRLVRADAVAALPADARPRVLDVVRNPNPGWPLCWTTIAIEGDAAGDLVLHRGTVSLLRAWQPESACAWRGGPREAEVRVPIADLRDLAQRDCWARAWLQFGRAPYLRGDQLRDLRFEDRGNFTALRLRPGDAACPPHVTDWAMPRADVLSAGP